MTLALALAILANRVVVWIRDEAVTFVSARPRAQVACEWIYGRSTPTVVLVLAFLLLFFLFHDFSHFSGSYSWAPRPLVVLFNSIELILLIVDLFDLQQLSLS